MFLDVFQDVFSGCFVVADGVVPVRVERSVSGDLVDVEVPIHETVGQGRV